MILSCMEDFCGVKTFFLGSEVKLAFCLLDCRVPTRLLVVFLALIVVLAVVFVVVDDVGIAFRKGLLKCDFGL